MPDLVILHNPRCSKSRAALAILTERGVDHEVVRYLDDPPDRELLTRLLDALDDAPAALVRTGDRAFADAGVATEDLDDPDRVVDLLLEHPALMERPVVLRGDRAVIGRPPERVETLLH